MKARKLLESIKEQNMRVDVLLRKKRKLAAQVSADDPLFEDRMAQSAALEKEIETAYLLLRHQTRCVSQLIDRLPVFEERETLTLRHIRLLGYPDIAEILGYCERQIYRIHHRALSRLETLLSQDTSVNCE